MRKQKSIKKELKQFIKKHWISIIVSLAIVYLIIVIRNSCLEPEWKILFILLLWIIFQLEWRR